MGDEKTLTTKLEAFMEQMAIRQQALEKQITKGDSEKNNEKQGNNECRKRNSYSQHGRCMVPPLRWNSPLMMVLKILYSG
ncbi:hypothetical protein PVK06_007515 [Gossypium arboreum]|uniref:Uncharacterized protein n=1 Tax=Gossypium arboreum TaxID=29729 RepID=A0ABR0QIQ6_GOSAR|nr:hypothetical protein PVK06_007515 [Gossypium arboreum]